MEIKTLCHLCLFSVKTSPYQTVWNILQWSILECLKYYDPIKVCEEILPCHGNLTVFHKDLSQNPCMIAFYASQGWRIGGVLFLVCWSLSAFLDIVFENKPCQHQTCTRFTTVFSLLASIFWQYCLCLPYDPRHPRPVAWCFINWAYSLLHIIIAYLFSPLILTEWLDKSGMIHYSVCIPLLHKCFLIYHRFSLISW